MRRSQLLVHRGRQVNARLTDSAALRRHRWLSVTIDGHDIRNLTLPSLRGAIGVVAQDPHLFHVSIVTTFASPILMQQMASSCRHVKLHEFTTPLIGFLTDTTPWLANVVID